MLERRKKERGVYKKTQPQTKDRKARNGTHEATKGKTEDIGKTGEEKLEKKET